LVQGKDLSVINISRIAGFTIELKSVSLN